MIAQSGSVIWHFYASYFCPLKLFLKWTQMINFKLFKMAKTEIPAKTHIYFPAHYFYEFRKYIFMISTTTFWKFPDTITIYQSILYFIDLAFCALEYSNTIFFECPKWLAYGIIMLLGFLQPKLFWNGLKTIFISHCTKNNVDHPEKLFKILHKNIFRIINKYFYEIRQNIMLKFHT